MLLCARHKSMLNAPCLYGGLQSDCGMDDCAESMCPMEVVPAMTLLLLSTCVISLFDSIEEGSVGVPLRHVLRAFGFYAADGSRPDSQPCRDIALQKSRPLPPCGKAGTGGMPRSCRRHQGSASLPRDVAFRASHRLALAFPFGNSFHYVF